jgi:hypothetical protein
VSIFAQAIQLHMDWKVRLAENIQEQIFLDPKSVQDDHQCPLGTWIDQEGPAYQHLANFSELRRRHSEFHQILGEITSLNNVGAIHLATEYFRENGAIERASRFLIETLRRCEAELRQENCEAGEEDYGSPPS